jgi:hypothetical protein
MQSLLVYFHPLHHSLESCRMDSRILTVCCWLLVFLQIVFAVPMGVKVSRDENRLDDGMAPPKSIIINTDV